MSDLQHCRLTLGPLLFNWQADVWRDFYFRVADEGPFDTVYIGEVICAKRAPFFEPHLADVVARLQAAGKTVILSSLAQVMHPYDRKLIDATCASDDFLVEVNDASALYKLSGQPFHAGPFLNIYNERTLARLVTHGAANICLPTELPKSAIEVLGKAAAAHSLSLETQIFGRMSLALSARCYHARAHGRTKDSCQFVCERDADGMDLATMDKNMFLAINGIQTMSHEFLNLAGELEQLASLGVSRFRLSPHSCDMIAVANAFQDQLEGRTSASETLDAICRAGVNTPFANGFFHHQPGFRWLQPAAPI